MNTSLDKSSSSTINNESILNTSGLLITDYDRDQNSRNYRIKIKRPKSAFFTSSLYSTSAISKPGNSPSPPPRSHHIVNTDQLVQRQYTDKNNVNGLSHISPYAYLKNSYKKNLDRHHYFYTKEEMADYQDHVALNQMFMSKTCHSFVNNTVDLNKNITSSNNHTSANVSCVSNGLKSSSQTKSSKIMNRYGSAKTNFLFNAKPR